MFSSPWIVLGRIQYHETLAYKQIRQADGLNFGEGKYFQLMPLFCFVIVLTSFKSVLYDCTHSEKCDYSVTGSNHYQDVIFRGVEVRPTLLYYLTLCQHIINCSCMHVFIYSTPNPFWDKRHTEMSLPTLIKKNLGFQNAQQDVRLLKSVQLNIMFGSRMNHRCKNGFQAFYICYRPKNKF